MMEVLTTRCLRLKAVPIFSDWFQIWLVWVGVRLGLLLVMSHQGSFGACQGLTSHKSVNSPTRKLKTPHRDPFPLFGCLGNDLVGLKSENKITFIQHTKHDQDFIKS